MTSIPQSTVNEAAENVYESCMAAPTGHLFTAKEIQSMIPGKNMDLASKVLNELLSSQRLSILQRGSEPVFKVVSRDVLDKLGNMTADEKMLYGHIEDSAREGIWTKTLKQKTNMHATSMNKALRQLEHKRYVKAVRNVKFPTRKIYMLYELTPSIDVSGGPWFTDSELDSEFVNELLTVIAKYITTKSFPRAKGGGAAAMSFPPGYTGYPSLNQIYQFLKNSNMTQVELAEADVKSLVDVLVYDGQVERVTSGTAYRAVRKPASVNGFTESPCGQCPVFNLCYEGGPVSASNCKYFDDWLTAF